MPSATPWTNPIFYDFGKVEVLYKPGSLILSQVFESKQNQFSRKGAKLAKKGHALGLKPGFKDFLCVLCGFARDAFVFDFVSLV